MRAPVENEALGSFDNSACFGGSYRNHLVASTRLKIDRYDEYFQHRKVAT
jgi:hypothetical protein